MNTQSKQSGFLIHDIAEFSKITVFDLDPSIPLESQNDCPSCSTRLKVLCTLVGNNGNQNLRSGFCSSCGYVGYIDRPTKSWMVNFYTNVWDKHIAKSLEEVRSQKKLIEEKKGSRIIATALIGKLSIDKTQPVCEIGSGYGNALRYFKDTGFQNVFGTENSEHRARLVSEAFGVKVFAGNFEGQRVQEKLKSLMPIGLFFSHHVFEHVYSPAEVIASIASLQKDGGHLILALPNGVGEHTSYGLFYLPHLHAFTKESLERLLNRYSYELVADDSPDDDNMILAFKKVGQPQAKLVIKTDYTQIVMDKYYYGLGLDQLNGSKSFEYCWLRPYEKFDDARMTPMSSLSWFLKKLTLFLKAKAGRFTSVHYFFVEPLKKRFTNTPFEIQYPRNIQLLMK